jgi:hypothetical protein
LQSVSNNIGQLLASLSAKGRRFTAVAIGLETALNISIAIYRNWDLITRQFQSTSPFERPARDVEGMKRELHEVTEEMGKLEQWTSHTADQAARYNELTSRSLDLHKQITEETETQNTINRLKGSRTEEDTERGHILAWAWRQCYLFAPSGIIATLAPVAS